MSRHKHYQTYRNKEKLTLASKPFAGGGEGDLYAIASPRKYSHLVAKIYHPQKRTADRIEKIKYLIKYAPNTKDKHASEPGQDPLVWPVELIYQGRNFVGILMPLVKGKKLEVLTLPKLPKALGQDWRYFERNKSHAKALRMRVCFNLAVAVHQVHTSERYILVDLKPDNVVIQHNGQLSLVDMDSVEVVEGNKILYQAPVATPEYTPPEYYRRTSSYEPNQDPAWDLFSLGVIFYRLLLGIHPFAASAKPPFDRFVDLSNKIKHGLFVHNLNKKDIFSIVPAPHQAFHQLDKHIQHLFIRCFDYGHKEPSARPSAEEWCTVLAKHLDVNLDLDFLSSRFAYVRDDIEDLLPQALNEAELNAVLDHSLNQPRPFADINNPKKNVDYGLMKRIDKALPKTEDPKVLQNSIIFLGIVGVSVLYFSTIIGLIILGLLIMGVAKVREERKKIVREDDREKILQRITGVRYKSKKLKKEINKLRKTIGQKISTRRKNYSRYNRLYKEHHTLKAKAAEKIRDFKKNYNRFVKNNLEAVQQFLKQENAKLNTIKEEEKKHLLAIRDQYSKEIRQHPVFEQMETDNYTLLMEHLNEAPSKLENINRNYHKHKTQLTNNYKKQTAIIEKEIRSSLKHTYEKHKDQIEEKFDDEIWEWQQKLIKLYDDDHQDLDKDEVRKIQKRYVKKQFYNYPEYRKIQAQIDDCKQELEDIHVLRKGGHRLSSFDLRSAKFLREEIEDLEDELDRLEYELEHEILRDLKRDSRKGENVRKRRRNPNLAEEISDKLKALKQQRRADLKELDKKYKTTLHNRLNKVAEENKAWRKLNQEYEQNLAGLENKYEATVKPLKGIAKKHKEAQKELEKLHKQYLRRRSSAVQHYKQKYEKQLKDIDKRVQEEKKQAKRITREFNQEVQDPIKKFKNTAMQYKKMERAYLQLDQDIEQNLIILRPMETLAEWLRRNKEEDD